MSGKPRVHQPCRLCGKPRGEHLASSLHCPTGKKSRIGWISFSRTQRYEPVPMPDPDDGTVEECVHAAVNRIVANGTDTLCGWGLQKVRNELKAMFEDGRRYERETQKNRKATKVKTCLSCHEYQAGCEHPPADRHGCRKHVKSY
jgi:hypothetical protein